MMIHAKIGYADLKLKKPGVTSENTSPMHINTYKSCKQMHLTQDSLQIVPNCRVNCTTCLSNREGSINYFKSIQNTFTTH
eukprot:2580196-Ditylum_brightwellii.AAC.1